VVAGDVVKITNSVYGFNNALFRVTRVQEVEGEDGMIVAGITALQYNANVYADTDLVDYNTPPITDIPLFGGSTALAAPSKPVVTDDPTNAQFVVSSVVDPNNYPVNRVEFYFSTTSTGDFAALSLTVSNFNPGDTIISPVSYYALINGDYYFKTRVGSGNLLSDYSEVSDVFVFSNGNVINGGGINNALNADNVLINNVVPLQAPYYLALTEGRAGDYYALDADSGLVYDADTKKLYVGGWEVSTTTNYLP
jgi:hypothetical protein